MCAPLVSSSQQGASETPAPLISMFSTALVPWASGRVFGEDPGCVYPSTVTGSMAFGSHVVSAIVCTPAPGNVERDRVRSGVGIRESRIAWRSEPAPESLVFVTVKVAAERGTARGDRQQQR